jgi:uncharacterized protein
MKEPLAWYIAGPLIGLFIPIVWYSINKSLGVSSGFVAFWNIMSNSEKVKAHFSPSINWQLWFGLGLILSGIIFSFLGYGKEYVLPTQYSEMPWTELLSAPKFLLHYIIGGIAIGYGARLANGCTAGHCIYGVSQLSIGSLLATLAFFVGGLFATYVIYPFISTL